MNSYYCTVRKTLNKEFLLLLTFEDVEVGVILACDEEVVSFILYEMGHSTLVVQASNVFIQYLDCVGLIV